MLCAPGRVNLLGEHTDYHEGFVLPAAIGPSLLFALAPRSDHRCRLLALNTGEEVDLSLNGSGHLGPSWLAYVRGVVEALRRRGATVGGFEGVFGGDLPVGAGLSSSAALDVGLAFGLNHLFGLGLNRLDLARVAREAEVLYAGVHCGIMDPYAILFGEQDAVLHLDCRAERHEVIPFALSSCRLMLFDTGVRHSLAASGYNQRREEATRGLGILQEASPVLGSLRDVDEALLEVCRPRMEERIWNRCAHVVAENRRTHEAAAALRSADAAGLGQLMLQTHADLRDRYEVSCPEADLLVRLAQDCDGVWGGRIMGGGFGGSTLHLVEEDRVEEVGRTVAEAYRKRTGRETQARVVRPGPGVRILEEGR